MIRIPGLRFNHAEILHHLEVPRVIGSAKQGALVEVLAGGDFQQTLWGCIAGSNQLLTHLFGMGAACTFRGAGPEMDQAVGGFSRVVDHAVIAIATTNALRECSGGLSSQ